MGITITLLVSDELNNALSFGAIWFHLNDGRDQRRI